jgi:hypothetical protein
MAIAAAEIKELGRVQGALLDEKIRATPAAKLDYREEYTGETPDGKAITKTRAAAQDSKGFIGDFRGAVAKSETEQTTVAIDDWIFKVNKPTFSFKPWLCGLIDGTDRLNVDGMARNNSEAVPEGIFESSELDDYFSMSLFGCGDAGAFPGCIANNRDYYYKSSVLNRAFRAAQDSTRATNDTLARNSSPGGLVKLSASSYIGSAKTVYEKLKAAKLGICTTFAWGAAYLLMERLKKAQSKKDRAAGGMRRIEVVAFTNHIFTIINRAGAALDTNAALPGTAAWGDDVIQVDAWLGTLGHAYVYKGVNGTNAGFLSPLTSLFDSKQVGWT